MAKKQPARSTKAWSPDAPLKVDWSKVSDKDGRATPPAEKLEHADNPLVSQGGSQKHPATPANHQSHIRQKKV
jgi:hypothetical protein